MNKDSVMQNMHHSGSLKENDGCATVQNVIHTKYYSPRHNLSMFCFVFAIKRGRDTK